MPIGPPLWQTQATDVEGTATVRLTVEPDNKTGLAVQFDDNGKVREIGVRLTRHDLQQLRHAATARLVLLTPEVTGP